MIPHAMAQSAPTSPAAPQAPAPEPAKAPAGGVEPQDLLEQAKFHMGEANRLHNERLQSTPPTPEHHKTGLGVYLTSLLLSGLDPTHQAGAAFHGAYEGKKNQQDAEKNQASAQKWLHGQQIKSDEAKAEGANAGAFMKAHAEGEALKEKSRESDSRTAQTAVANADRQHYQDETLKLRKAAEDAGAEHRQLTTFHNALYHSQALLGSEDEATRRTASVALANLAREFKGKPGFEGVDFDGIEKIAHDAFLKPSSKETSARLERDVKKAREDLTKSQAKWGEARASQTAAKSKAELLAMNQKLQQAKIKFPKDMARLDAEVANIHARTKHLNEGGVGPEAVKNIERMYKSTTGELRQERNTQYAKMRQLNPMGRGVEPGSQGAYDEAKAAADAITGKLQFYNDKLTEVRSREGMKTYKPVDPVGSGMMGSIPLGPQPIDSTPTHTNAPEGSADWAGSDPGMGMKNWIQKAGQPKAKAVAKAQSRTAPRVKTLPKGQTASQQIARARQLIKDGKDPAWVKQKLAEYGLKL